MTTITRETAEGHVPWANIPHWLRSLGLSHLEKTFQEHEVTSNEIAHVKEHHLIDMGVTSVGDRLRIVESTQAFLRGERNRRRQKDILVFSGWTLFPCTKWVAPHYHISESAIIVREWHPFRCSTSVNNVDISSVTDVALSTGCCFAWLVIDTKDPSVVGGKLKVMVTLSAAKRIHTVVKNLVEEDELKMGLRGGKELEELL